MKDELDQRFPIPQLRSPEESSFDLKPKAVDRWLGQLPLGSVENAAAMVIVTLEQVNSHDFALNDRLYFLDALREPVSMLSTSLRASYLPRELPLPQRAQAVASLDHRLMIAMSLGYRVALARTPDRGIKGVLSRKTIGRLPNCILGYLASALLVIEECALNYPQGLWSRIHALYQFAVRRRQNLVTGTECGPMGNSTVETTYKGILLLALSGVHQFPRLEADPVVASILKASREARLRLARSDESAIVVDTESDRPPVHSALGTIRGERFLALDAPAVFPGPDDVSIPPVDLSAYTVARLRNRWSASPDRMHPRLASQKDIRLLPGLTHVHRYLATLAEPSEPLVVPTAAVTAEILDGVGTGEEPEETILLEGSNAPDPAAGFTGLYLQGLRASSWSRYAQGIAEPVTYATVDVSPGGYRVRFPRGASISLRLGDIVATQERGEMAEEVGRWPIGIIRWVSSQGEHSECGIQLISPYAVPVMAVRAGPSVPHREVEGLLLPCASPRRALCTILLPDPHLKQGELLEIRYGQNVRNITLGAVQDHGHGFTAYAFTEVA